jgi:DNA polymerase beta
MKRALKLKSQAKIDLRQRVIVTEVSGKQKIIDVMTQLIDHTTAKYKNSTGKEKSSNQFRLNQFKKALNSISDYPHEITSGEQAKQLDGIGKGIADRIDEIIQTGTVHDLAQTDVVVDPQTHLVNELTTVTGIGEAHAKKFIEQGVTSLDDLRTKAAKGQVKLTHHMEVGLRYHADFQQRIPYKEVLELKQVLTGCIHDLCPDIIVEVCGSHRRLRPLSGDIDVLMTHTKIVTDEDLISSQRHYLKEIVKALKDVGFITADLTTQGDTKYMGVCVHPRITLGRRIDIRFVPLDCFYPALLYFTGSMMCNKLMRTVALEKGYTLNEYGLYRVVNGQKDQRIIVTSEQEVFDILGIVYLEPKDRELI